MTRLGALAQTTSLPQAHTHTPGHPHPWTPTGPFSTAPRCPISHCPHQDGEAEPRYAPGVAVDGMTDVLKATLERGTVEACEAIVGGWWVMESHHVPRETSLSSLSLPWLSHLCCGVVAMFAFLGKPGEGSLNPGPAGAAGMAAVSLGLLVSRLAFYATHKP